MADGIVFNIQHFTIHDGPGIRTEVFLKGCPLRCQWCSNPESMDPRPEVGVHASRCIGVDKCGYCLSDCPKPCALIRLEGRITGIDPGVCTRCLRCARACPANALTGWGKKMTVNAVLDEIKKDREFYEKSGGGATLSGGEALVQWEFTRDVLAACRKENIHTCLETALHCPSSILDPVYVHTDLVITDIKHMDPEMHRAYTGVDNRLILSNIKHTADTGIPLIIRIPVIPGVNSQEANIRKTARFIIDELKTRVLRVELLPYRPLGLEKYQALGRDYPMAEARRVENTDHKQHLLAMVDVFQSFGIRATPGAFGL